MHLRSQNKNYRLQLSLRQVRQGVVVVRASNDTLVDEYGTTITVEALMRDWFPAFWQHRTISLQHNLTELRGIRGKPFVGRARRVDFTPQLEVEVEVLACSLGVETTKVPGVRIINSRVRYRERKHI